jgi:anti-sigma-K factor RskA
MNRVQHWRAIKLYIIVSAVLALANLFANWDGETANGFTLLVACLDTIWAAVSVSAATYFCSRWVETGRFL